MCAQSQLSSGWRTPDAAHTATVTGPATPAARTRWLSLSPHANAAHSHCPLCARLAHNMDAWQRTLQWLTYSVDREKTRRYCSACERSAGSCTGRAVTGQLGQRGPGRGAGSAHLRLQSRYNTSVTSSGSRVHDADCQRRSCLRCVESLAKSLQLRQLTHDVRCCHCSSALLGLARQHGQDEQRCQCSFNLFVVFLPCFHGSLNQDLF